MPVPSDLTCAVCDEPAEAATDLSECLDCSRWFHLNPYSNRPGKDCGDAIIGQTDGVETICADCIEAAERLHIAALGPDRVRAQGLAGAMFGGHMPIPPAQSGEPPAEGTRRTFRRVNDE